MPDEEKIVDWENPVKFEKNLLNINEPELYFVYDCKDITDSTFSPSLCNEGTS